MTRIDAHTGRMVDIELHATGGVWHWCEVPRADRDQHRATCRGPYASDGEAIAANWRASNHD